MTKQEMNIKIAEACGWKRCDSPDCNGACDIWWSPGEDKTMVRASNYLPDYCNDLNAMRDAEKTIRPLHSIGYLKNLYLICEGEDVDATETPSILFAIDIIHATALQRAETFIKTIGA